MTELLKGVARGLSPFTEPQAARDRVCEIYEAGAGALRRRFDEFLEGGSNASEEALCYPYVGMVIDPQAVTKGGETSYGKLPSAGAFGTTLTRPDLFHDYYREQLELLLQNYDRPIWVGSSHQPIPLSFVIEEATADLTAERAHALRGRFPLPELSRIDDAIANGTYSPPPGTPKPLALFSAPRIDYSLVRLKHYTATSPKHFQRFVLFTNYQRYVDEFIAYGRDQVLQGEDYVAFVEPGDVVTPNPSRSSEAASGQAPEHRPQMPAYHLVRDDHEGITLVNIGIGPSNAKTITDHLAVLRPHCWLMVGHCGGLRLTQRLGDYVLAHAYVRSDHVLDEDPPSATCSGPRPAVPIASDPRD